MKNLNPIYTLLEGALSAATKGLFTGLKGSARKAAMLKAAETGMHNGVQVGAGSLNQLKNWAAGQNAAKIIQTKAPSPAIAAANKQTAISMARRDAPGKAMFKQQGNSTLFGNTGEQATQARLSNSNMKQMNADFQNIKSANERIAKLKKDGATPTAISKASTKAGQIKSEVRPKLSNYQNTGTYGQAPKPVPPRVPLNPNVSGWQKAGRVVGATNQRLKNVNWNRAGKKFMRGTNKLLGGLGMLAGGTALGVGATGAAALGVTNSLANSAGALIHGPNNNY